MGKGGFFLGSRKTAETGEFGEQLAVDFLSEKGFEIIERNYTIGAGEIDIVAKDGSSVVFVEVKTLTRSRLYNPEDQVSRKKRRRIEKAAGNWMLRHPDFSAGRFDVISVLIENGNPVIDHFEDAWNEGE